MNWAVFFAVESSYMELLFGDDTVTQPSWNAYVIVKAERRNALNNKLNKVKI